MGRPTVMTPEVIAKLEYAYSVGATDAEACNYAGIDKATLYRFTNESKTFAARRDNLKETMPLKSRCVISASIEKGDVNTAKWYLERRKPEEFGAKTQIDVTHTHRLDDTALLDTFSKLLQGVGSVQVIDAEYTEQGLIEADPQISANDIHDDEQ